MQRAISGKHISADPFADAHISRGLLEQKVERLFTSNDLFIAGQRERVDYARAAQMASAIYESFPWVHHGQLASALRGAFENAVGHGVGGDGKSTVVSRAEASEHEIRIRITNNLTVALPPSLRDHEYRREDGRFVVPDAECNAKGGWGGFGVADITTALGEMYHPFVVAAHSPTARWIEDRTNRDRPLVHFELTIPIPAPGDLATWNFSRHITTTTLREIGEVQTAIWKAEDDRGPVNLSRALRRIPAIVEKAVTMCLISDEVERGLGRLLDAAAEYADQIPSCTALLVEAVRTGWCVEGACTFLATAGDCTASDVRSLFAAAKRETTARDFRSIVHAIAHQPDSPLRRRESAKLLEQYPKNDLIVDLAVASKGVSHELVRRLMTSADPIPSGTAVQLIASLPEDDARLFMPRILECCSDSHSGAIELYLRCTRTAGEAKDLVDAASDLDPKGWPYKHFVAKVVRACADGAIAAPIARLYEPLLRKGLENDMCGHAARSALLALVEDPKQLRTEFRAAVEDGVAISEDFLAKIEERGVERAQLVDIVVSGFSSNVWSNAKLLAALGVSDTKIRACIRKSGARGFTDGFWRKS